VTTLTCHIIHKELSCQRLSRGGPQSDTQEPTGAMVLRQLDELLPAHRLPACLPSTAPLKSFCQPDMQLGGGKGHEHRQLPAPATALLRLGNFLSVFEP